MKVSKINQVSLRDMEIVSVDDRRTIQEVEFTSMSLTDFNIVGNAGPLGQHYHRKKTEVFYVIGGGGRVRTIQVAQDGQAMGKMRSFDVSAGSVLRIPPMQAHRFDLAPGTRMICLSSTPFNPDDLIAHTIEDD